MPNTKEIQNRMSSIKDTMKITNAMYLISSTKLKKAKRDVENTEPYFYNLHYAITRMLRHMPDIQHRYFDNSDTYTKKEEKKKGYLVITGDKGMAGAYNHNVLKQMEELVREDENAKIFVVGEMGRHYCLTHGYPIEEAFHYTVQNPTLHRARNIARRLVELYKKHEVDEVSIIFTKMDGAVTTETEVDQLLPLQKVRFEGSNKLPPGVVADEFLLFPTAEAIMDNLVPNYITGFIFGALVEAYCSEQNSRMMAMDAANKSAGDMLHELEVQYNRVRQAAITQEITEVISGAKALKKKKQQAR